MSDAKESASIYTVTPVGMGLGKLHMVGASTEESTSFHNWVVASTPDFYGEHGISIDTCGYFSPVVDDGHSLEA